MQSRAAYSEGCKNRIKRGSREEYCFEVNQETSKAMWFLILNLFYLLTMYTSRLQYIYNKQTAIDYLYTDDNYTVGTVQSVTLVKVTFTSV